MTGNKVPAIDRIAKLVLGEELYIPQYVWAGEKTYNEVERFVEWGSGGYVHFKKEKVGENKVFVSMDCDPNYIRLRRIR